MRIWSLHPQYLDSKGLVALWRETLLAKAVLAGQTKGYRNHPQLLRFIHSSASEVYISAYLKEVHIEAVRRGYQFDPQKIGPLAESVYLAPLPITTGQMEYEWAHLQNKLRSRAPEWLKPFEGVQKPLAHPLFCTIEGGVAAWEIKPKSI